MLKVEGPAAALLATRTVPLLYFSVRASCLAFSDHKRRTYIELVVCGYAACASGRTKRRACNLVPSSEIAFEVELGVWDRVKAFSVILRCDDIGSRRCGLVAGGVGARVDHA